MPCQLDTTGTTYTFYEITKGKETKNTLKQRRQIEREKEKRKKHIHTLPGFVKASQRH